MLAVDVKREMIDDQSAPPADLEWFDVTGKLESVFYGDTDAVEQAESRSADELERQNYELQNKDLEMQEHVAQTFGNRSNRNPTPREKQIVEELFNGGFTIVMFVEEFGMLAAKAANQAELGLQGRLPSPLSRQDIDKELVSVEPTSNAEREASNQPESSDAGQRSPSEEIDQAASYQREREPSVEQVALPKEQSNRTRHQQEVEAEPTVRRSQRHGPPPMKRRREDSSRRAADARPDASSSSSGIQNDRARLKEIRSLVLRRNITLKLVKVGSGITYRKVQQFFKEPDQLLDEDIAKLISWYERCKSETFRFNSLHPVAVEHLEKRIRELGSERSLRESARLAEEATEVVRQTMGEYYEDWAAVRKRSVYTVIEYRRKMAAASS